MAVSVIQVACTMEFEDGLRTGVLPGDYHCYCVDWIASWSWFETQLSYRLLLDQNPTCLGLHISSFNVQLLFGVRTEPAKEVQMSVLFPIPSIPQT